MFESKNDRANPANATSQNSETIPARLETARQNAAEIDQLTRSAEDALGVNDIETAAQNFQALEKSNPGNLRAAEGLRRVEARRRHILMLQELKGLLGKSDEDEQRAATKLREILIENPDNMEARAIYKALTAKHDARLAESLRKHLVYKTPISLQFRDVSLKVMIEALAKGTKVNFILDQEISNEQKATLFVNQVSLEDALDLLVQTNQLRKKILDDHTVIIYPNTSLKLREYQDLVVRSFYLEYADPKMVGGLLTTMLGIKQVQTDDRLPMIMVKDNPDIMPLVEKLIASQDVPDPEVMLELEVVEISRTKILNAGITWPNQLTVITPTTTSGSGVTTSAALTLAGLQAITGGLIGVSPNPSLIFQGQNNAVNLLSNPRIRVKNKDKAKIMIGDRIPIVTSNVSSTGTIAENVQYIDVGLKLEVEPIISLGGDVSIKVNLDVSTKGASVKTASGNQLFQIGTRSTSTQLRLKDGETQVLAGLISDSDTKNIGKLPGLGDMPLLGRLFSNNADQKDKTEIVLSITPHIIRERQTPTAATTEYWIGSEAQVGREFRAPMTREGISKLFVPGIAPAAPAPAAPPTDNKPQNLNIPLPADLLSPFTPPAGNP